MNEGSKYHNKWREVIKVLTTDKPLRDEHIEFLDCMMSREREGEREGRG